MRQAGALPDTTVLARYRKTRRLYEGAGRLETHTFLMQLLITICARGGSKGIPGKNIRLLNEKPLIAYSIETAKRFASGKSATIALSTDSEAIKAVAAEAGLPTNYTRPADLANDAAGKIPVLKHLLEFEERQWGKSF